MKQETAKKKLFEALDKAYSKYGVDAGMCNPGFYPHYSEVNSETMRPTWYTEFEVEKGVLLYTWYDAYQDICISTLFDKCGEPKVIAHPGYPKTMEEAKIILTLFKKD